MAESRAVVITGASRGLGFASAVRLYRDGWRVVAAMRTPDCGMPLLQKATGAGIDDDRLIGVQLDLIDAASIAAAAKTIEEAVGAPYALVHNAGISAAGMVEETDLQLWQNMFDTHLLGPVALTKALLPGMRAAGQGRIVLVSSAGGVRGQPSIAPYSDAKGALQGVTYHKSSSRWHFSPAHQPYLDESASIAVRTSTKSLRQLSVTRPRTAFK